MAEPTRESTGPWVSMAVFCDQVIEDKQGVLSLIRVIDRFTVEISAAGIDLPQQLPPGMIKLTFVIGLKAGTAKGRCEIEIGLETPDGQTKPVSSRSVSFAAQNQGANIVNKITMGVEQEGVYWFNVKADGRMLTRAPLEIQYIRSVKPPGVG